MYLQVSQGMVGQGAARRAAGIILEMVKVRFYIYGSKFLDHSTIKQDGKYIFVHVLPIICRGPVWNCGMSLIQLTLLIL